MRGARLGTVAERKIEYESERKKIAGVGLLTALVVVLQLLGSFIKFGTVSISLVLVPIVVGAALYGVGAGAWLGGVFSVVVLCQPDTALFLNMSIFGTILTVMLKGILAGHCPDWCIGCYKKHKYAGVVCAVVVCPVVNTGSSCWVVGCFSLTGSCRMQAAPMRSFL